ncbi:alpha/beta fold hydrolase [Gaetbulibacter sp. M240]|uniref:alpha/beta fold hydrolase n=1 Tax=Gaetbulibacter sp. M240 TaxID=3126511 RepID=UPI00374EF48C
MKTIGMKFKLFISLIIFVLPFLNLFGQTPTFEKCDCPFDISKIKAESIWCGKLKVPENREVVGGRMLEIMFSVIEPENPKPNPIVLMPGGPGVPPVANRVLPIVHSIMPSDHTFIVFDPRGTGLSDPEMCKEQRTARAIISSMDLSLEEERLMYKGAMLACRSSLKLDGIDINQYNSVTIAQDVHDLMNVLGYDKWNIFGGSYGVPHARMAMRLYPEEINSVVISNGADLNMMDFLKYDRRAMHNALQDVANRCKQNKDCNARFPNIEQAFYDTYNWLKEEPLTIEVSQDEFEFPNFTFNSHEFVTFIYHQLFYENEIIHLPAVLHAFANRDLGFIKKLIEYEYGSPST